LQRFDENRNNGMISTVTSSHWGLYTAFLTRTNLTQLVTRSHGSCNGIGEKYIESHMNNALDYKNAGVHV